MISGGGLDQATKGVWTHSASHPQAGQGQLYLSFVSTLRILRISVTQNLNAIGRAHGVREKGQLLEPAGDFGLFEILQHPGLLLGYMQTPTHYVVLLVSMEYANVVSSSNVVLCLLLVCDLESSVF